jgi:pimeloyl-ACP methyl ester carboxylesterase
MPDSTLYRTPRLVAGAFAGARGLVAAATLAFASVAAAEAPARIGVVVMHGKGGSPTGHVAYLASSLERRGYVVANLEMPWSERRSYDVSVADAAAEVESALAELRSRGAARLFVAGHSQGGLFALYIGGKHPVDGIIAIAPGGNVASPSYREKLGQSVARARQLVADGKANEPTRFLDFEGSRGTYPVVCTPANYLSWFDPEGAMNELLALRNMNRQVPVLFIVPTGDYPVLLKAKDTLFAALPHHPLTALYQPGSSHLDAATASLEEIERWTAEVAAGTNAASPQTSAGGRP